MVGGHYLHGHRHGLAHRHLRSKVPRVTTDHSAQSEDEGTLANLSPSWGGYAPRVLTPRSSNLDEKPAAASSGSLNLVIGLGIAIPLAIAFVVLIYLHRRNQQRLAREDADDKYKSMDFGLGDNIGTKGPKRKSALFGKEKNPSHRTQLSMDMNLSSPYLLPPTLQHSRESLNTLAKSLHNNEDPYRPVTEYTHSDVGSLRSFQKDPERTSSVFTGKTSSSGDRSSKTRPAPGGLPPRQTSLPSAPLPQLPPAAQTPQQEEFADNVPPPMLPAKNEFRFNDDELSRPEVPSAAYAEQVHVPTIQEPPAAASKIPQKGITETVRPFSNESVKVDQSYVGGLVSERESMPPQRESQPGAPGQGAMGSTQSKKESMPVIDADGMQDYQYYSEHFPLEQPDSHQHPHEAVGEHMDEQAYPQSAGLGVPEQDNRRLSVGFRPLPPEDFLESEDPEFRANRIRSFYKEYFEDSTKQDTGKPPPIPQQATYYEDYDQNYLGDAAYFDPDTNAFVMPYAAPVTRRAMTPPPNSRRPMPGPRHGGPPGPMPMPRHRPRAGSTMSAGRWAPMSPRPDSSASNPRYNAKPRKPMPPPAPLSTLPTPSKLKDDSFAILNAMDFAPPPTFKDQVAGRSQSPVGERVPYRAGTPVHTPLISSFDETAALPSPHLLRKSGTFTALDFAPPRRFKDPDTMSDAGSVVSNRSGLSSKNAIAIRNGAGRVSRLPGDTVFTQADMTNTLKPQWGMRP